MYKILTRPVHAFRQKSFKEMVSSCLFRHKDRIIENLRKMISDKNNIEALDIAKKAVKILEMSGISFRELFCLISSKDKIEDIVLFEEDGVTLNDFFQQVDSLEDPKNFIKEFNSVPSSSHVCRNEDANSEGYTTDGSRFMNVQDGVSKGSKGHTGETASRIVNDYLSQRLSAWNIDLMLSQNEDSFFDWRKCISEHLKDLYLKLEEDLNQEELKSEFGDKYGSKTTSTTMLSVEHNGQYVFFSISKGDCEPFVCLSETGELFSLNPDNFDLESDGPRPREYEGRHLNRTFERSKKRDVQDSAGYFGLPHPFSRRLSSSSEELNDEFLGSQVVYMDLDRLSIFGVHSDGVYDSILLQQLKSKVMLEEIDLRTYNDLLSSLTREWNLELANAVLVSLCFLIGLKRDDITSLIGRVG